MEASTSAQHPAAVNVSDGVKRLCKAAYEGDMRSIEILLRAQGININQASEDGFTPLHLAAYAGNTCVIQALLKMPYIQVNKAIVDGATPLYMAAQQGYLDVVEALLKAPDIDVNSAFEDGATPLYIAASGGCLSVLEALLKVSGIEVNKACEDGVSPLFIASQKGYLDIVQTLLKVPDIDVNKAAIDGATPLFISAQNGCLSIVEALLKAPDIDVNSAFEDGATPLYIAASKGYLNIVEALLQVGDIEANKACEDGATPLFIAAQNGCLSVVQTLLKVPNIEVNKAMEDGAAPLYIAAYQGHLNIIEALLSAPNIEVNKATTNGETSLYIAAYQGYLSVVEALLKVPGIEVNKAKTNGVTPLFIAAQSGCLGVVETLLKVPEIDVNKAFEDGASPLFIAAQNGFLSIVEALLKIPGIQVNKAKTNGSTPLLIAVQEGHFSILSILLKVPDIDVNKAMEDGDNPLYIACYQGYVEFVKALLKHPDINVNQFLNVKNQNDNVKQTILMKICGYGQHIMHEEGWRSFAIGEGERALEDLKHTNKDENDLIQLLRIHEVQIVGKSPRDLNEIIHLRPKISELCNIIAILINHQNIDIDIRDENGKNALLHACKYGHAKFVKLLLQKVDSLHQSDKVLFETIGTEIEWIEKLDLLFARLDLQPNLKNTIKLLRPDDVDIMEFKGNILVASIVKSFDKDDATCLKQIFQAVSNSTYTLEVTIEVLGENQQYFNNVLDLLVFYKKFSLVYMLFQGMVDGYIKINQLKFFLSAIPNMLLEENFQPTLTSFVENQQQIAQNVLKDDLSVDVNIGTPIVSYLKEIVSKANNYNIFKSMFLQSSINDLWTRKIKWYYSTQFTIFSIYFILFICAISFHLNWKLCEQVDETIEYYGVEPILWVSLPFVVLLFASEILQIDFETFYSNNIKHFDFYEFFVLKFLKFDFIVNLLDWFILCTGIVLPFSWSPNTDLLMAISAIFVLTLFVRFTIWILPNKQFGHYVLMMYLVTQKTFQFILILLLVLIIFTLSFMIIFQNLEKSQSYDEQLFITTLGLFGNIELVDFYDSKSPYKETGLILLTIFIVIVPVQLINLLIALMSSIYDDISTQKLNVFYRSRTFVALEAIQFFENCGKIVQFFKFKKLSVFENSQRQNWNCCITVKSELEQGGIKTKQVQDYLQDYFQNFQSEIKYIKDEIKHIKDDFTRIDQNIDKFEQYLTNIAQLAHTSETTQNFSFKQK